MLGMSKRISDEIQCALDELWVDAMNYTRAHPDDTVQQRAQAQVTLTDITARRITSMLGKANITLTNDLDSERRMSFPQWKPRITFTDSDIERMIRDND